MFKPGDVVVLSEKGFRNSGDRPTDIVLVVETANEDFSFYCEEKQLDGRSLPEPYSHNRGWISSYFKLDKFRTAALKVKRDAKV